MGGTLVFELEAAKFGRKAYTNHANSVLDIYGLLWFTLGTLLKHKVTDALGL
jgi:hypothetical protein